MSGTNTPALVTWSNFDTAPIPGTNYALVSCDEIIVPAVQPNGGQS